jgi:hypothetical protein
MDSQQVHFHMKANPISGRSFIRADIRTRTLSLPGNLPNFHQQPEAITQRALQRRWELHSNGKSGETNYFSTPCQLLITMTGSATIKVARPTRRTAQLHLRLGTSDGDPG